MQMDPKSKEMKLPLTQNSFLLEILFIKVSQYLFSQYHSHFHS